VRGVTLYKLILDLISIQWDLNFFFLLNTCMRLCFIGWCFKKIEVLLKLTHLCVLVYPPPPTTIKPYPTKWGRLHQFRYTIKYICDCEHLVWILAWGAVVRIAVGKKLRDLLLQIYWLQSSCLHCIKFYFIPFFNKFSVWFLFHNRVATDWIM